MLLRSLSLSNIRSYNGGEETNLDLPEGVVLFEGDIGSGKSSLLYAIEFALFGFSDMKGSHLLSEGRREGRVALTFESGGTEYTLERKLRLRGADVVQEECHIAANGEKERLSPSDLKERVVSVLGFNEPTHPKAESLVYRYAVFTPQEQMKEILLQNPDERLQVIRRVLGAQSYQVAAENSEIVEKRIREISYGLKKVSEDIEAKKDEVEEKTRAVARLESEVPRLRATEAAASSQVKALEEEWIQSREQKERLSNSEAKIPVIRQRLEDLKNEAAENDMTLRNLEDQLTKEVERTIRGFESMDRPKNSVRELQAEGDRAKERIGRLGESRRNLESELTKSHDLVARGVCPLCGQPVPGDLPVRTEHTAAELSKVKEEEADARTLLGSLIQRLEAAQGFEESEKEYLRAMRERSTLEKEIGSLRKRLQDSDARSALLAAELAESERKTKDMREVSERIGLLESRLKSARSGEKNASQEVAQAETELAGLRRELAALSAEVRRKEVALSESRRLSGYRGWLSSFFRPTVELIEKQTLAQAASRFDEHFQKFFTTLVDDPDMVVRVREDFSPIFEREGFEQEYAALSGGERTSMALAYRFALNAVVKENITSRPELLILDEPTDGFSKEQVYRMRGLLEELGSRQVILVSHERELESMADHIFRIEKRNGATVVQEVRS